MISTPQNTSATSSNPQINERAMVQTDVGGGGRSGVAKLNFCIFASTR